MNRATLLSKNLLEQAFFPAKGVILKVSATSPPPKLFIYCILQRFVRKLSKKTLSRKNTVGRFSLFFLSHHIWKIRLAFCFPIYNVGVFSPKVFLPQAFFVARGKKFLAGRIFLVASVKKVLMDGMLFIASQKKVLASKMLLVAGAKKSFFPSARALQTPKKVFPSPARLSQTPKKFFSALRECRKCQKMFGEALRECRRGQRSFFHACENVARGSKFIVYNFISILYGFQRPIILFKQSSSGG